MKLIKREVVLILFLFLAGMLYSQPAPSKPTMPPPPSREHSEHLEPPPRPPKDESRILNYRGNRTYNENLPLKINQIRCTRFDEKTVCIEILFNQNINPRSFKKDAIFIDNNLLPEFCRFSFNRRGDTVKFVVPMNSQTFKLKILNVRSFSGNVIEPVEMLVEVSPGL